MTKQTIEIDVPDGHDIDNVLLCTSLMGDDNRDQFYRVQFKKKEPEYLEVREYLHSGSNGYVLHNSIQKNLHQKASDIESLPGFIRWVDDDWRKIYI